MTCCSEDEDFYGIAEYHQNTCYEDEDADIVMHICPTTKLSWLVGQQIGGTRQGSLDKVWPIRRITQIWRQTQSVVKG